MKRQKPFMIAHRGGAALAPENTLAALRSGIAHGATVLEVDLQRTADNELLIFHDAKLDRVTNGTGQFTKKTWAELQELDAGSYFSSEFTGERIPTLDDALAFLKEHPMVTLVIEAKDATTFPGIEDQLLAALDQHDVRTQVIVISFDHPWLQKFKALAPDIPVGLTDVTVQGLFRHTWADIIAVYWGTLLLFPWLARRMRQRGFEVWAWTVNTHWGLRIMRWLGVQGITTDHPDRW